ncbi:hypothetical protein ACFL7D_11570, partial [candidate division KSB1 bacterium]
ASDSNSFLCSFINDYRFIDHDRFFKDVSGLCWDIRNSQPYMASVQNQVLNFMKKVKEPLQDNPDFDFLRTELLTYLKAEKHSISGMLKDLGKEGTELISPFSNLLTYSASDSVFQILRSAERSGKKFSVVLSEARPMKEGVKFAKRIAKMNIPVTLVVDMYLPHFIPTVEFVLIGADWISETQFTNKIGTGFLVDLAHKQNIPVYIAASTDKILAQKYYPLNIDSQPQEEILRTENDQLTVKNRYFEAVLLSGEMRFITEKGILELAEIVSIAGKTRIKD